MTPSIPNSDAPVKLLSWSWESGHFPAVRGNVNPQELSVLPTSGGAGRCLAEAPSVYVKGLISMPCPLSLFTSQGKVHLFLLA